MRRREAAWGNFTWLSIGVLLQSANDRVAKLIDPAIVNEERMDIVAGQRAKGINANDPIELKGAKKILLLGDPGEMDASQYVLLRELYATDADTLILMSDIVYPAGNVNAWRDAVYLPYLGLPRFDFKAAVDAWTEDNAGASPQDPDVVVSATVPFWRVFATPGNHDWYDGLTGYMFHACSAEPRPSVLFSGEGLTRQQRIARALWQPSARPKRATLEPLRVQAERFRSAAQFYHQYEDPFTLGDVASVGPVPRQPGPYFSIDAVLGERRARLVTVDTGIDGSVDVEQAIWVRAQLRGADVPKIVITGKPLVVDQEVGRFPVEGGPWMDPSNETNDAIDDSRVDEDKVDLRDLIQGGDGVIATVAGDIHNYQRMILRGDDVVGTAEQSLDEAVEQSLAKGDRVVRFGAEGGAAVRLPEKPDLPPLQIVAGGGGAYLKETHRVRLDGDGGLALRDKRTGGTHCVPHGRHTRYPSREESVLLFGNNVRPGVSGAIMSGLGAAGSAVLFGWLVKGAAGSVSVGDFVIPAWRMVLGAYGTVAVALILVLLFLIVRPALIPSFRRSPVFWAVSVPSVVAFAVGWWTPFAGVPLLLGGALLAMAIPLLLIAVPLLRAYPSLRRLLPTRTVFAGLAAGLSYLAAQRPEPALLLLVILAVVGGGYWLLKNGLGAYQNLTRRWAIEGRREGVRAALLVPASWPLLVPAAGVVFGASALRDAQEDDLADALAIIAGTELLLATTAAGAVAVVALWKARRTAPIWLLAGMGLVTIAGFTFAVLRLEQGTGVWNCVAEVGIALWCAVGAGLVACGLAFWLLGRSALHKGDVEAALKGRDLGGSPTTKSVSLFRILAVSSVPGLGQIAESTQAPFYKSFLLLKLDEIPRPDLHEAETSGRQIGSGKPVRPTLKLEFLAYGVKDERGEAHWGEHPATNSPTGCGSYEIDRVSVLIP